MLKRWTTILLLLSCLFLAGCDELTSTVNTDTAIQYVGSINSDKYHLPECQWAQKIKPENEVWFDSVEDAEGQGYQACKTCEP